MKIQKTYQGAVPLNRIANEHNESDINTYSTNYTNSQFENINTKLDIALPIIENTKFKVLWTNPAPSSTFPSQTITVIDDSPYEYIMLIFDGYVPYENFDTFIFKKPAKTYQLPYGATLWNGSSGNLDFRERYIKRENSTTYSFYNGTLNGQINNDLAVPIKIMGFNLTEI